MHKITKLFKNKVNSKDLKSILYIFKLWFKFFRIRAVLYVLAIMVQPIIYVLQVILTGILIEIIVNLARSSVNFNSYNGFLILGIPKNLVLILFLQLVLGFIEFVSYYVQNLMETTMNLYAETFHDTFIGEKFLNLSAQQFEDHKIASQMVLVRENMIKISDYPQYFVYGFVWTLGIVVILLYVFKYNFVYGLIFFIYLVVRYRIYKNLGVGIYSIWNADAQLKQKYLEYNSMPYQTDIDTVAEMRVMGFHRWFLKKSKQFNNFFVKKFIKTENRYLQKNYIITSFIF